MVRSFLNALRPNYVPRHEAPAVAPDSAKLEEAASVQSAAVGSGDEYVGRHRAEGEPYVGRHRAPVRELLPWGRHALHQEHISQLGGTHRINAGEPTHIDLDLASRFGRGVRGAVVRYQDQEGQFHNVKVKGTRAGRVHFTLPSLEVQPRQPYQPNTTFHYSISPLFSRGRGRTAHEPNLDNVIHTFGEVYERPEEKVNPRASYLDYRLSDDLVRNQLKDAQGSPVFFPEGKINIIDAQLEGRDPLTNEPIVLTAADALKASGRAPDNSLVGPTGYGLEDAHLWHSPVPAGGEYQNFHVRVKAQGTDGVVHDGYVGDGNFRQVTSSTKNPGSL